MKRIIVLIAFALTLSAQSPAATITLSNELNGVNSLSLNDFDLLGAGNSKRMFELTLDITTLVPNLNLQVELKIQGRKVLRVKSETIKDASVQTKSFSNDQIAAGFSFKTGADGSGSESLSFKKAETFGFKMFSSALDISASLPEGTYSLTVSAFNGATILDSKSISFRIQNNWSIALSDPEGDINNQYPTFRWSGTERWYDDENTKPELYLFVYEDKGTQAASISRKAILQTVLEERISSFTFPAINDRQLEDGKSYYWTIKTRVKSINGRSFKDNRFVKFTYGSGANSAYDEVLSEMIGPAYIQIKKELKGYKLKTVTAKINGVTKPAGLNLAKKAVQKFKEDAAANGKTARINVETID